MADTIIIGIVPPSNIERKILSIRKHFSKESSDSKYVLHQPHMTIYMDSFNDLDEVILRLKNVKSKFFPLKLNINGVGSFPIDPVTGEQVWKLNISNDSKLRKLRNNIINSLADLKTMDHADWMLGLNPNYTSMQKKMIKLYSIPIAPEDFKFHITLFSTTTPMQKLPLEPIKDDFEVPNIHILKYDGKRFVKVRVV